MSEEVESELIGMAEIARLAGQSRSTVGNWKKRNPETFPVERGRSKRGPLYDRDEALIWIASRYAGPLHPSAPSTTQRLWQILDELRGVVPVQEAVLAMVFLLAEGAYPDVAIPSNAADDFVREELLQELGETNSQIVQTIRNTLPILENSVGTLLLDAVNWNESAQLSDSLVQMAVEIEGAKAGDFATPDSLGSLMSGLLGPVKRIYDPCLGFGSLSIAQSRRFESGFEVIGQDINSLAAAIAVLNFKLHLIPSQIGVGDAVSSDIFPNALSDGVLMSPPLGQRFPEIGDHQDDARWRFGEPRPIDGDFIWAQIGLHHLAPKGRMVTTMGPSSLFASGNAGRVLQRMIRSDVIDAIVTLPPGIRPGTGIETALFVFDFSRSMTSNSPGPSPVLLIDGNELLEVTEDRRRPALTQESVDALVETFWKWKRSGEIPEQWAVAPTYDEIVSNDYVLDPRRYFKSVRSRVIEECRAEVQSQLQLVRESLADSAAADTQFISHFGGTR